MWSRIALAAGLPFIFVSITTASYDGLPKAKTNQASALINVARNLGGSFGVALAQATLARSEQINQSYLVSHAIPSDPAYQAALQAATDRFTASGSSPSEAAGQALGQVGQLIGQQASYLAYIDVFWTLTWLAVGMVPLALLLRNVRLGSGAGH